MLPLKTILEFIETIAPAELAVAGDKNGLVCGSPTQKIARIFLALDATIEVLDEVSKYSNALLFTHHPRFYRGLADLNEDNFGGNIANILVQKKIALFTAHTNLDIAPSGINAQLAKIFALQNPQCVEITHRIPDYKLVVFVPRHFYRAVTAALAKAGAGEIGDYRECFYRTAGIGSFLPQKNAKPTVGKIGKLSEIEEFRVETIVRGNRRLAVENALLQAHPYEKPAYDFIPLSTTENFGFGRYGELPKTTTLRNLAQLTKQKLPVKNVLFNGALNKKIRKVAVWSGAGVATNCMINAGVDALICGELNYHEVELLRYHNIAVIIAGHAPIEFIILPELQKIIQKQFPSIPVTIAKSRQPEIAVI